MVVYGLLNTADSMQYVRIEKAFLGPNDALSMAQNYDSINYMNNLDVWLKEIDSNGNLVMAYQLQRDTSLTKEAGIFAFPAMVVYSMPTAGTLPFLASHTYRIEVTNLTSGLMVSATTSLVSTFAITRPSGSTIDLRKFGPSTMVMLEWNGSPRARIYQVIARFQYRERDINGVITNKVTPDWQLGSVKTTDATATNVQRIEFDPNDFYKYLRTVISNDPNVLARESDSTSFQFVIYAGGEELNTYMEVNAPSTSLVQEKPLYTNINNGIGLFSSRFQRYSNRFILTNFTKDTLAKGQYSCNLQFLDHNQDIDNPLDLPPGCQ